MSSDVDTLRRSACRLLADADDEELLALDVLKAAWQINTAQLRKVLTTYDPPIFHLSRRAKRIRAADARALQQRMYMRTNSVEAPRTLA